MKKTLLFASVALLLAACTNSVDEVRQFAIDFAKKVSNNKLDSVRILYPDAAKCDSLALSFVADSVKVTETETPGTFIANYSDSAEIRFTKAQDGKMTIISSRGLFAYPADAMKIARSTGQWTNRLNDAELAERMADKDFKPWLIKHHFMNAAKKLKVVGTPKNLEPRDLYPLYGVTVQSQSDLPISGDDYKVYFKGINLAGGSSFTTPVNGKDVAPHGTVTIMERFSGGWQELHSAYVNTTLSEEAHFNKYFCPTGNEYEEYLKTKK